MTEDEVTRLARALGRKCLKKRVVVATAESCTGGGVATAITRISGSAKWFDRGFVTYSNDAEQELLGVRGETLERHGAVSEDTAREMAQGALARSKGTVALAITGIAGPGGGSLDKPVGTVCFAWAGKRGVRSETRRFMGDRQGVRRQSVIHALEGVLKTLDGR